MKCTCDIEAPPGKDASEYNRLESKFHVAKYDPESVAKSAVFSDPGKFAIRTLFNKSTFRESLFGSGHTISSIGVFLISYIVLQILYQQDVVCHFYSGGAQTNLTECRSMFKAQVARYKDHNSLLTPIIMLLLGFYVAQVVRRWYCQIVQLPDMCSTMNYMTGLIYPANTTTDNTSLGALELTKKICRYCILSWTMCLSAISSPLNQAFATGQDYVDKELITREELDKLKSDDGSVDGWKDSWCVPLVWASKLVNINFNHPKAGGGKGLIPKDHNKLLNALSKFQKGLQDTRRYQDNPLPIMYKQAILLAVYFWMILGVFSNQNTHPRHWAVAIFFNLPFYPIVQYLLILSWLKVVDFIRNPFEHKKDDRLTSTDVYLKNILDAEIWRTSVSIKTTNQAVFLTD